MLSQKPSDILCPSCGGNRVWKDGLRYPRSNAKPVQRYVCRECGYRFSEPTWNGSDDSEHVRRVHTTALYSVRALPCNRQVGVAEAEGTKNLAEVKSRIQKQAAGATETKPSEADAKSRIFQFSWWMKKKNYAHTTIDIYTKAMWILVRRGANILDPESVKEVIAKQNWGDSKRNVTISALPENAWKGMGSSIPQGDKEVTFHTHRGGDRLFLD